MRQATLILAGFVAAVVLASNGARAQTSVTAPEPNSQSTSLRIDACASDPSRLGLSRVVEIDTAGGPQFGGGHGGETDFLKDGEVVLTFDDGPMRTFTRPVLRALADECTKATFFMVGRMAAADPAMAKEVAAAGHTVASHTWQHLNMSPIGILKGRREFEMGLSAVNKALGKPAASFFRFPYLSENRFVTAYAKSRNISTIWVDVDSKDYMTRDAKLVHSRIMSQLKSQRKGIILMHDIQPSTAHAIKGLLRDLHDKGFKVVHIVPKTSVDAVAFYDGAVDQVLAEKTKATAANPAGNGSVVLSMSPGATGALGTQIGGQTEGTKKQLPGAVKPALATGATAPPAGAAEPAATANGSQEELPWLKQPIKIVPAVRPPPKPKPAPSGDILGLGKIFGY
jgi:peptidoglycan-N-acetylglucosamine deacetylase